MAPSINVPHAEFEFRGQSLLLDHRGVLYWPDEGVLVVADLHLEKGSSFAAKKRIMLPPYDSQATLQNLAICLKTWSPKTVISLGDSFHDDKASARLEPDTAKMLGQIMKGRNWVWISGNHDPSPPVEMGGEFTAELYLGPFHFIHEPKPEFSTGEIAGHLHPAAKTTRRGKSIRRRCFASDGRRMILPAFGAFTGGLNVLDDAYNGLFDGLSLKVWLLGKQAVYPLGARQLRK